MENNPVYARLEFTPNPNTLKFVVNRTLLNRGALNFPNRLSADGAPLVQRVFEIPGVESVLLGTDFITITKTPDGSWELLGEAIPTAIEAHLGSGKPVIEPHFSRPPDEACVNPIEKQIREVLDNEIRPAVAMDGGDITFGKYEDGIVYLHLQGSCSMCPSSVATLKMGVESRLKDVVPEIKEVVQI